MAVKKDGERAVRIAAPLPPIMVGARARAAATRYEFWLTVFLRCIAVLWLGEGLLQWLAVLTDESGVLFAYASPLRMAALFFFCVLDFVAAVGLWLATTWGVAVWVATIVGHALASALAPGFLPEPVVVLVSDALLVGAYAALVFLAAREERMH